MKLNVFNNEHDIALAYDSKYFTAPHAGRQLRNDLDYLPVLWAAEGDYVLVENVSSAQQHASRLQRYGKQVSFVDKKGVDRDKTKDSSKSETDTNSAENKSSSETTVAPSSTETTSGGN